MVTVEKIIASRELGKANFGYVFDDSIRTLSCAAGPRPPPPLSPILRTSFNASLFPVPQIQSVPGSVKCILFLPSSELMASAHILDAA